MKSICMSTLSYFTSTFVQNEDRNLSFIWPSESIFRLMLFANDALLTCISWKRKTMYNKLLEIVMLVTLIKTFSPNFIGLCHETKGSSLLNSAGFTYRLDRLKPQHVGSLRPRCIIFLTLLLNFHTYAVITYCTF